MICADCGADIKVTVAPDQLLTTEHICLGSDRIILASGLIARQVDEVELSGVTVFEANRMKKGEK